MQERGCLSVDLTVCLPVRPSIHPVSTARKQSGRRADSSEREVDNVPLFNANSLHRLEHRLSSVLHTRLSLSLDIHSLFL
jgi:hypothetical protein